MSHRNTYRTAYFRTTLLPFASLAESASIVQSAKDGSCDALVALLGDGPVAAALENASPSLFARVQAELAGNRIRPKTASALLKYLSRMASRCTPFGLMSGVVYAQLVEGCSVDLQVLAPSEWLAFPRVSYERTFQAARDALRSRIERSEDFAVRLTGTMEHRDGRIKVLSFHHPSGRITPAYEEVVIDEPLQVVLDHSGAWLQVSALSKVLSERLADVSLEEARDYVLELLACGVLQDTFYPSLDPANAISPGILETCADDPGLTRASLALKTASRPLPLGDVSRSVVCEIARRAVADLGIHQRSEPSVPSDPDTPAEDKVDGTALQIDLAVQASSSSVGATLVEEALRSLALLSRLPGARNAQLAALKEEFTRKFGEDSVCLLRATAPDDGLSLNRFVTNKPPFLITLPIAHATTKTATAGASPLDALMLEKLIDTRIAGRREIVLDAAELEPYLEPPANRSARSGHAMFDVFRRTPGGDDAEGPTILLGLHGASIGAAGSISARFAHLDARLESAYKACFAADRLDDAVDADILYLPSERLGNVSCRPPGMHYQIPIFGYSTDEGCEPIELSDLFLRLDARQDFVLTSRKLGKRVRPRLASAHNYLHPECAPVYQFLAMLNQQDGVSPAKDLLPFARRLADTPAVRLGSLILTPRTWRISRKQMGAHGAASCPRDSLRSQLRELGIHRFVKMGQHDNLVTLDLETDLGLDLLLEEKELVLMQAVPDGYEPACVGSDGLRQVELALQYVDPAPLPATPSRSEAIVESQVHRHGLDPWNYLKLYGGPHAIDTWVGPIADEAARLREEGRIAAWHFVRFRDPDPHLRLRWRAVDAADRAIVDRVLSSIAACASPNRTCAETFFPEAFRYGGPDVIETVYDLFTIDSAFVAELLKTEHAGSAEGRVKLGVLSARALAQGMGLDDRELDALWDMLTTAFVGEFGGKNTSSLRKRLGGLWRDCRAEILALRETVGARFEAYAKALADVLGRSDAWGNDMTRTRVEICADVIHMHANRLFMDQPRECEMCCYALAYHFESTRKFRGA